MQAKDRIFAFAARGLQEFFTAIFVNNSVFL